MTRVLVVDDEPPARRKLLGFLKSEGDFEVVAQACNGAEAVDLVLRHRPEVVFLDIQMPQMDGFQTLQALKEARPDEPLPLIVFVTAFDRFALQAFEVCALDYLLKPFDRERLGESLERVRDRLASGSTRALQSQINRLLDKLESRPRRLSRLMVKSHGRVRFLKVEDIEWIEASANYVDLHVGARSYLLRETLSSLEEKLDAEKFVRVHRSHIVNLDGVREIHPFTSGDYVIVMESGARVRMSRRYRERLEILRP